MRAHRKHPIKRFGLQGIIMTSLYAGLSIIGTLLLIKEQEYVYLPIVILFYGILLGTLIIFFNEYRKYKLEIPGVMIDNDILVVDNPLGKSIRIPMFQIKEATFIEHINNRPKEQLFEMDAGRNSRNIGEMIKIKYYPGIVPKFLYITDSYKTPIRTIYNQFLQEMDLDVKE